MSKKLELKEQLHSHNVMLKKKYGQNFLTDTALLSSLVEKVGVNEKSVVVEIGCGAGTLTKELSKVAKKVYGYEIDTTLKPILSENLSDFKNVEISFSDIMKENIENLEKKIGEDYIIVANLPYYITTPIVTNFLENAKHLKSMSVMVQKEVADRFSASPKNTDYGAITVAINLRGSAKTIMNVDRKMFTPPPNVDSAVVKIDIEKDKFAGVDLKKVRNVVRIAFSSRRKTLVNNLINGYKIDRATAENIVLSLGKSVTERGECLSAEEFVNLSKILEK